MAFPNLADYKNAISNARARFASLDAVALTDRAGAPQFLAGNFAGVFKMARPDGEVLAVKCFTRTIAGLERRYHEIAAFTASSDLPHFVPFHFLPAELYVTSKVVADGDYPVVVMPWLEARTLGGVVALLCDRDSRSGLAALTRGWARLCLALLEKGVAHGDLKHDNVLVTRDGALRLIDYDSMYLPALKGLHSSSLGSPNFQHPGRNETHFDAALDHFSMLTVLAALRFLTFEPQALSRYDNGENILFGRQDFLAPDASPLFGEMRRSPDIFVRDWAKRLEIGCGRGELTVPGLKAALNAAGRLDVSPEQRGLRWLLYRWVV